MKIELKDFRIGSKERFRMLAGNYFRKNLFLYIALGLLWIYFIASRILRHEAFGTADLALALIIPAVPLVYLYRFRKTAKDAGEKEGSVNGSFDDRGLHLNSPESGEEHIPWQEITKKEMQGKYLYVYISRVRFIAIPETAFPDAEALKEVLEYKVPAGN